MAARLLAGEEVTLTAHGNSMTPIIRSSQKVTLSPLTEPASKGDAVLAKVGGRYYIHKVTAIRWGQNGASYQISNNSGHVNGWTSAVFGKVTSVE